MSESKVITTTAEQANAYERHMETKVASLIWSRDKYRAEAHLLTMERDEAVAALLRVIDAAEPPLGYYEHGPKALEDIFYCHWCEAEQSGYVNFRHDDGCPWVVAESIRGSSDT